MEAEECVQLWHASFGPEAQPPETLGKLSVQDVATKLKTGETRVEALQTQLARESRVLEWLRRVAAELERRQSREKDGVATCRLLEGEGEGEGESVQPASLGVCVCEQRSLAAAGQEPANRLGRESGVTTASLALGRTWSPADSEGSAPGGRISRRSEGSRGSSEYFSAQPEGSGVTQIPEEGHSETALVGEEEPGRDHLGEKAGVRERFVHKVDTRDKSVARAVKKRLIEQGRWWSSNLLTLESGSRLQSPVCRRRSISDPSFINSSQTTATSVTADHKEEVRNLERAECLESHEPDNTARAEEERIEPREKLSSSTVFETDRRALNEAEEKRLSTAQAEEQESTKRVEEKLVVSLDKVTVRRTHSQKYTKEVEGTPVVSLEKIAVRRTHSQKSGGSSVTSGSQENSTRSSREGSTLSLLEVEGGSTSTLKRRKASIEAKAEERRRSGGWKVVEVSGAQRKLSKNRQEQDSSAVKSNGHIHKEEAPEKKSETKLNGAAIAEEDSPKEAVTSHSGSSTDEMLKAAKEKLTRVTSSPPLRRRPSRDRELRRAREGNSHRTSNGQLESSSSASAAVVEEVMVERRVERSDSLLSEIMAHRFSNGLDGSQLLESGEHSLVSSQESSSDTKSASPPAPSADTTPKVILRRRSERDADSLPEAKRRSSYLEDDDCSTPKEEYSNSLTDENMQQGLTKSMVDAASLGKEQLQRLGSDSTLRQESLEATLTPSNSLPSSAVLPQNVNFRMSYMTAVRESPQINYMPLIDEADGGKEGGEVGKASSLPSSSSSRLQVISSEANLVEMELTLGLEDSMELDEATISAVTLNNDLFGSRSGSVTSLPETLEDTPSTSVASLTEPFSSLTEPFSSPGHDVVNLRQTGSSGSGGGGGRRKNRRRMGNAELDQTGASLEEMLSSEGVLSPSSNTASSRSSISPMSEDVSVAMSPSPSTSLFSPAHHPSALPHIPEVESPGSTRSSRIYPVRRSTVVVQGEKLVIRKLVVAGIVSAEKSYLDCLNVMKEFYRKPLLALATTSQPILTEREINTVFYRTEDLVDLHTTLHEKLESQLRDWSINTCVGDFFVELCKNLKLYKDYVEFYRQSLKCLEKIKAESANFKKFLEDVRATVMTHYKDVPRVNELLRRPIERLQSYSLVLNDLCQHTPEEHKDYNILRQSLHAMSAFIASTHDPQSFSKLSGGYNRELVKEGLMVELSEGIRKVRRVFLFHDVIVSSKQKPTRTGMKFEPKWFLPLSELTFHPPEDSAEANRPVQATSDIELSVMRNRIAELKAQIGKETPRDRSGSQPEREGSFRRGRGGIRSIYTMKANRTERTRKKLQEQQVSYWMAFPSLPLRLYGDSGKNQYMFLLHSEQERENWLSSIKKLQPKAVRSVSFQPLELQDLLNHQTITELKKIEEVTLPMLEDEYLSGILRMRIMTALDIKAKPGGLYCALELDEYGRFERKAKTLPVPSDPTSLAVTWDQDFEVEVVGAHMVKVNICSKQLLKEECYAHGKIRLPIHELRSNKRHKTDITLYPQGSVQIIIEYSSSASRDRKPALLSSGVFGVPIEVVAKRERHDIPLIVETCVEEVERRGMSEVGIYRVAGVLRDVRELRDAFDTDYLKAQVIAFEADIHAVAGLLKKYFRELPDPLFTDGLYLSFVQGLGLSDPEARDQCLVTLLYSLPPVNFKTAIFLFKHLRRIAADSELNKMNLNNLATLFGPNLLRPAPIGQEESLLNMAAVDVATPVNVLMYFLNCPDEFLEEAQVHTSPASTASTGRGRRKDSRRKLAWIEEEDGTRLVRTSRRSSGRNSQT